MSRAIAKAKKPSAALVRIVAGDLLHYAAVNRRQLSPEVREAVQRIALALSEGRAIRANSMAEFGRLVTKRGIDGRLQRAAKKIAAVLEGK